MPFIPIHDGNPLRHITAPYAAWSLIAANCIVYLLQVSGGFGSSIDVLAASYGLIPSTISNIAERPASLVAVPDNLTLLTSAFLHADFWHLAGNMLFLWVFADNVEDAMGHVRFAAFYILSAVGAGLLMVVSDPSSQIPTIGASGAVSGVVAAYFLLHPTARVWVLLFGRLPIRLSAFLLLGGWLAYQLFAALNAGDDGVAWFAHVGGLITGGLLTLVLRRPGVPLFDRSDKTATLVVPAGKVDERTTEPPPAYADNPDRRGPWG